MIRRPPKSTLFPTRRSSDLPVEVEEQQRVRALLGRVRRGALQVEHQAAAVAEPSERVGRRLAPTRRQQVPAVAERDRQDRKSTRLNSSHANIPYAVFCLKKK